MGLVGVHSNHRVISDRLDVHRVILARAELAETSCTGVRSIEDFQIIIFAVALRLHVEVGENDFNRRSFINGNSPLALRVVCIRVWIAGTGNRSLHRRYRPTTPGRRAVPFNLKSLPAPRRVGRELKVKLVPEGLYRRRHFVTAKLPDQWRKAEKH